MSIIGLARHIAYPVEGKSVLIVGLSRHITYPMEAKSVLESRAA